MGGWGGGGGGCWNLLINGLWQFFSEYEPSLRHRICIICYHYLPRYQSEYHLRILFDHSYCENKLTQNIHSQSQNCCFKKVANFGGKIPATRRPFACYKTYRHSYHRVYIYLCHCIFVLRLHLNHVTKLKPAFFKRVFETWGCSWAQSTVTYDVHTQKLLQDSRLYYRHKLIRWIGLLNRYRIRVPRSKVRSPQVRVTPFIAALEHPGDTC